MNWWQTSLSAFSGTAAALAIAGSLSKAIYEHWLKKDFKRFELKLDDISNKHRIRFTYFHQKQAESIAELYSILAEAHGMMTKTSIAESCAKAKDANPKMIPEYKRKWEAGTGEVERLANQLQDTLVKNRIYITDDISQRIENARYGLMGQYILSYNKLSGDYGKRYIYNNNPVAADELAEIMQREMKQTLLMLAGTFRALLEGAENEAYSPPKGSSV
jgi:hypothetical protein